MKWKHLTLVCFDTTTCCRMQTSRYPSLSGPVGYFAKNFLMSSRLRRKFFTFPHSMACKDRRKQVIKACCAERHFMYSVSSCVCLACSLVPRPFPVFQCHTLKKARIDNIEKHRKAWVQRYLTIMYTYEAMTPSIYSTMKNRKWRNG